MRFSLNTQWGHFYNDRAEMIGHTSADVAEWLAAHPAYRSNIWFNFGDGSDDLSVEEVFFDEAEEADEAQQVAA